MKTRIATARAPAVAHWAHPVLPRRQVLRRHKAPQAAAKAHVRRPHRRQRRPLRLAPARRHGRWWPRSIRTVPRDPTGASAVGELLAAAGGRFGSRWRGRARRARAACGPTPTRAITTAGSVPGCIGSKLRVAVGTGGDGRGRGPVCCVQRSRGAAARRQQVAGGGALAAGAGRRLAGSGQWRPAGCSGNVQKSSAVGAGGACKSAHARKSQQGDGRRCGRRIMQGCDGEVCETCW